MGGGLIVSQKAGAVIVGFLLFHPVMPDCRFINYVMTM